MKNQIFDNELKNLTPINKTLKSYQVYNDYNCSLSSTGYLIASNSNNSDKNFEILPNNTEKVLQRPSFIDIALKNRNFVKTETKVLKEGLYYSRKPRAVDFVPYSVRDYQDIKAPIKLGGLGSWRIGSKDWEMENKRTLKMKTYSEILRNYNKK